MGGAHSFAAASWTIPYSNTASPAANVKAVVMTAAGVGWLASREGNACRLVEVECLHSGTDFGELGDAYGS